MVIDTEQCEARMIEKNEKTTTKKKKISKKFKSK